MSPGTNILIASFMVAVGHAIGFRFYGTLGADVGALGLVLLFVFAITLPGHGLGLGARWQPFQAAGGMLVFSFMRASSVLVPTKGRPWWLRSVAEHTPVSYTADAARTRPNLVSGSRLNIFTVCIDLRQTKEGGTG
jgi:hypothetical protein